MIPTKSILAVFVFVIFTATLMPITPVQAQKTMIVQVKQAQIRSTPSFLAKIMARPAYGEKVTVLTEKKGWMKVKRNTAVRTEGWMHGSALSPVRVILKSGDQAKSWQSSAQEVALAGKGFNQKIEGEYALDHHNLDYAWVDKMEKISPDIEELEKFVIDGSLSLEEGGTDE